MNWVSLALDFSMIGLLITGIAYASKLMAQLKALRAARTEMERFILDFNTTVVRAENSVKELKRTARSSGDDLEALIDKAHGLRDEMIFLVESADKSATRLSNSASQKARASHKRPSANVKQETKKRAELLEKSDLASLSKSSRSEQELLRALKKLG